MLTSTKLGRLVLLKKRVRDAERARLVEAEVALEESSSALADARASFVAATERLRAATLVSIDDLEAQAADVVRGVAHARAAEAAHAERTATVAARRAARIDVEREVELFARAEERAELVERLDAERREGRENDDRAAVQRSRR